MASSSKKRTTMAKLNRENAVREKRIRKAARKEARRLEAANPTPVETPTEHAPEESRATEA
jgi:glyceraldehyde-3-phosphate dehydrogenase/erythrose-4-phosphate dehydrogenase